MKSWIPVAALAGAAFASAPARADQCAWIEPGVAARALAAVHAHPRLVTFCEPCGDPAPGTPSTVTSVRVAADATAGAPETEPPGFTPGGENGMQELWVDGAPLDLAYAYVQTSPTRYENLAALAGCATTGVSPSLAIDPEPEGVLIRADQAPVAPLAQAQPPPAPPSVITVPIPAVIQTPPQIITVTAPGRDDTSAVLLALGGAACASAGWLAWLLLATRRRRGFAPRALGLGIRRDG